MGRTGLLSLYRGVRYPSDFSVRASAWFDDRAAAREEARVSAIRAGAGRRRQSTEP